VDPVKLPFDRFLNLVHFFMIDGAEEKDRNSFEMRLNKPPVALVGQAPPPSSPWSQQNEESALHGLAAALGGV
jgi:hypothetical protein